MARRAVTKEPHDLFRLELAFATTAWRDQRPAVVEPSREVPVGGGEDSLPIETPCHPHDGLFELIFVHRSRPYRPILPSLGILRVPRGPRSGGVISAPSAARASSNPRR